MGSFLLEKEVEEREDWDFMVDFTANAWSESEFHIWNFTSGMPDLASETDGSRDLVGPTEVVPF